MNLGDVIESPPRVLCVGGVDPTGAAGVAADLKTLGALGFHGSVAVTAVTVQTSTAFSDVMAVPASLVGAQMDAALLEPGADAIKTGMLHSVDSVHAVANRAEKMGSSCRLVLDPVLSASSGRALLDAEGVRALVERLLPMASLITPNVPEAERITGLSIQTLDDVRRAADYFLALGAPAVLIKGGHLPVQPTVDGEEEAQVVDLLRTADGDEALFSSARLGGHGFRGTGCVLGAAIAGFIAEGHPLTVAVERSRAYLLEAMRRTLLAYPLEVRSRGPLCLLHGPELGR